MSRRTQVVAASALTVLGFAGLAMTAFGGDLRAASISQAGFDLTKIFLWSGVGLLIASALLYIRASAD